MLPASAVMAFVGVKDLQRARPFDEDVLGLPLKGEEGTAALPSCATRGSLRTI